MNHYLHREQFIPASSEQVTDHVTYAAPFEPVENAVNGLWIKHRLAYIFDYRREKIKALFGES
jgi:transposase